MTAWLELLAGSVLCGAAVVWAMVLPRRTSALASLVAAGALVVALQGAGAVAERYRTAEAVLAAAFFLLAGGLIGYALSAAVLPWLATRRHTTSPARPSAGPSAAAVVLLACTDPERYDPRAVATLGAELAHDGAIDMPLLTTPLVYLAERARYRSLGGVAPGPVLARLVRDAVADALPDVAVAIAWTYAGPDLAQIVAQLGADGVDRIALVVLGSNDSTPAERARAGLDAATTGATPSVCPGPSLWLDRELAVRLRDRIGDALGGAAGDDAGVVLVCTGQPPVGGTDRPGAAADDTYFTQRVRMLLTDAGFDDRFVRVAWLEWQQPDLTDGVRHLAAMGCTRIVVAPATIALPTVATALDLRHAVAAARLPEGVVTTVLPPWGEDSGFVDAVVRSAREALGAR